MTKISRNDLELFGMQIKVTGDLEEHKRLFLDNWKMYGEDLFSAGNIFSAFVENVEDRKIPFDVLLEADFYVQEMPKMQFVSLMIWTLMIEPPGINEDFFEEISEHLQEKYPRDYVEFKKHLEEYVEKLGEALERLDELED